MLIRTQDKEVLINFNNVSQIYIDDDFNNSFNIMADFNNTKMTENGGYVELGIYLTKERALKVLDKIQEHYNSCIHQKTFHQECGYIVDNIYQMPQEEEA